MTGSEKPESNTSSSANGLGHRNEQAQFYDVDGQDDFYEFPSEPLGEYTLEFEEEEFEEDGDEYDSSHVGRTPTGVRGRKGGLAIDELPLADQAARIVLKWGCKVHDVTALTAERGDVLTSNGFQAPSEWSAALREDYEVLQSLAAGAIAAKRAVEMEGLIASMVPVALRLAPQQYRALWPALSALIQGSIGLARLLRAEPGARKMTVLLPAILTRTILRLAESVDDGQSITGQLAATVLAKQARQSLRQVRRRRTRKLETIGGIRRTALRHEDMRSREW